MTMELYLKKYFWLVPAVVVLVGGLFAARATDQVIEAKYLLGDSKKPAAARRKPVKREAPKPPPTKDADLVVARNMFCSTCEPARPAPTGNPAAPSDDSHPPNTSLPLALVATIMSTSEGYSTATITNTQTFKMGSYSLHDRIPDAGEVMRVQPKFVDFRNKSSNRLERIELLGVPPGAPLAMNTPPPAPVVNPVASGDPESELMAAMDKSVRKIDEAHYDIDRPLVEKILADPTAVARSARIVPSIKDGKANGFKLYAIRPNSVFARIGLQNGDTISSINGFDMSSPDKALEVYTKVKSASNLSVSVLRRGQPMSLEYSIK
jgi:general secretion pathway protein C